ncbi:hypothetical protein [Bifidobacterium cuniculi]|uniref:Uncharacterized protein n=1 Tax=Bifidobacterium cuniculi TaxID=1688 RepID=A0A087AX05_9BIFI|nr:hypothetical protein [Bifidobacterium cuniculi]KFI63305.1 hypothetical protein BCUN_1273 [Bifidobacterium cuniculi]
MFAQLASMILRGIREFDDAVRQDAAARDETCDDVADSPSTETKNGQG